MIYGQKQKCIPYHLFLLWLLINYVPKSYAEIDLDKNIQSATIINGVEGGKCITGNCIVSGGDKSGANIFHRFNSFDTRGSINSVLFKNENYKNVIVGVSSSRGSFIDKPISLSKKGNLFWVSPGGISFDSGADFINTSQLHLITSNQLDFSNGVFDVFSNKKYHLNQLNKKPSIVADTNAPTVKEIKTKNKNGSYKKGDQIEINIKFSEPIYVIGNPDLTLNTGNKAIYSSGNGTDNLTFIYKVKDGDSTSKLDYESENALSGNLKDKAFNNAILTLATPGEAFGKSISITGIPTIFETPRTRAATPNRPSLTIRGNDTNSANPSTFLSGGRGPSQTFRDGDTNSANPSTFISGGRGPSQIRVSEGGPVAPPKSIGGNGVRVSLAFDSTQGRADSSQPGPSSDRGGRDPSSVKGADKRGYSSTKNKSSSSDSGGDKSVDKNYSDSEKVNKKASKPSKTRGDRNKKGGDLTNENLNEARTITFAKVPNKEVLANLNKFMNRNKTNAIDVLNLDKLLNSGRNLIDIQRNFKIAKSKIRNTSSLSTLFYGEKLYASNSQSLDYKTSKIFFEPNAYNPAIMHIRFTKASGKTTSENTDSFLDITLIPSEGEVIGKRVELSMKEFGKNLGLLYSQLSRQENLNVELESSPSRVLNNMIFESIKPDLERLKVTSILISADRGLQAIPYAALHDGENYFGDAYAFSITPSLGLTDISFSDSEDKKLLAIGASEFRELAPLPLVGQELSKIGGTKNKEIIFNKEFTPESFFEKAIQEKYDMIHIATHAEFKPGGPNASRLFSGTTPITLDNFSILRKGRIGNPLDLVVFSACRTALGDPETELGFSGLALQAGAKSAIGTLWYVDDVMTSAYFVQMYKFLDLGIPKAEAMQLTRRLFAQKLITLEDDKLIGFNNLPLLENLNLSQKRLIKNGLNNPFFWAGIELMGSPW